MTDDTDDFERERDALADGLAARPNVSERVADAIRDVPRHCFVPESRRHAAYDDRPLPIGNDQTVSAPHMVAIMATELDLRPGDRVLEIGTGCGYHAAVTAELVGSEAVFSVEYVESLAETARENLDRAGYGDVSVRQGDGHDGWPEHAPYDAAYLTCAAPEFPDAVVEQVRDGGRLVAPIGGTSQRLVSAEKDDDGGLVESDEGAVRFVRMQGGDS
ncbi:protein-L-isoaspartate(D-aspartate) O-methyltransferase [Halobacterium sp. CBA1126]|uniref:protein-L-isoaspartate(D-aspartate) O-methyltransferase n=1 Tax=Halobacterium sp. CBA1126 TaxID=2668074 RepID=UPI0012F78936|nr:protein-L-isoaspartate(D-aspartate) O-methyltransferase [Halobacterium sp. CBA1126]MUV59421.1 protein-L-isoaspartate(D-aspartate) O-methyltransferase [Halobacterium sp. CBA1126]